MGQIRKHIMIAFWVTKWRQGEDTSKILAILLSMRTEMFCIQWGKAGNLYAWSHLLTPNGYMSLSTGSTIPIYSTQRGSTKNTLITYNNVHLIEIYPIIYIFCYRKLVWCPIFKAATTNWMLRIPGKVWPAKAQGT